MPVRTKEARTETCCSFHGIENEYHQEFIIWTLGIIYLQGNFDTTNISMQLNVRHRMMLKVHILSTQKQPSCEKVVWP